MCNPCIHCTKRNATCHAECTEYKSWAEKERALKKAYASKYYEYGLCMPSTVVTRIIKKPKKYGLKN